jgi:hypothetical protein
MTAQAVLAESEAKRNRHLQELEDIRVSREAVEAQLAEAEARLRATQAALAEAGALPFSSSQCWRCSLLEQSAVCAVSWLHKDWAASRDSSFGAYLGGIGLLSHSHCRPDQQMGRGRSKEF